MIDSEELSWSGENGSYLINDLCMTEDRRVASYVYHS